MSKGEKLWVKPEWATKKISEYEKQRMETIKENKARMNALGLHQAANSLRGSIANITQTSLGKGKRNMGEEDDEEYRPLEGEEGLSSSSEDNEKYCSVDEDDSSRYRIKKVMCV